MISNGSAKSSIVLERRLPRTVSLTFGRALWRDTILSNSQLKTKFQSHPIFKAASVSILSVKLDWLHTVDLEVAAYLHGSLLYSIMEELPGRNRS